jgi:hypothetical protein
VRGKAARVSLIVSRQRKSSVHTDKVPCWGLVDGEVRSWLDVQRIANRRFSSGVRPCNSALVSDPLHVTAPFGFDAPSSFSAIAIIS